MEVTSAWTGEKKTKIQSTPTSACGDIGEAEEDDASAMIIVQEGPEQLEGLDWDQDTLDEKIDCEPCVLGSCWWRVSPERTDTTTIMKEHVSKEDRFSLSIPSVPSMNIKGGIYG